MNTKQTNHLVKRRLAMKAVEAALSNLEAVIGDEPLRREAAAIRESFTQRIEALDRLHKLSITK